MARALHLPQDALGAHARIVMDGRCGVMVEGQRGVIELTEGRIRLQTPEGVVSICGEDLRLSELTRANAMISGKTVTTVTFGRAQE